MAGRKAFIVKVQLNVQAVTCPGVWLCSNGQVSLQIYMLDSCVQTSSFRPCFPMLFHEKFCFSKTLPTRYHLEDLNKQLSREWLYVELIQWENCECGNVLSYFQIPLNEFLYPATVCGSIPSGSEVDLLMESTPAFPGTIAPKLEVSTKTTIEETICSCIEKPNIGNLLNRKKILSSIGQVNRGPRAVCHSSPTEVHRNKKCVKATCLTRCKMYERPPFRYKKIDDGFLQRQRVLDLPLQPVAQLELDGGPDGGAYAGPTRTHPDKGMEIGRILKESIRKVLGHPSPPCPAIDQQRCICDQREMHAEAACTVCQKYSGFFDQITNQAQHKQVFLSNVHPNKNLYNQLLRQAKKNRTIGEDLKIHKQDDKNIGKCKAHTCQPKVSIFPHCYETKKETMAQKIHQRISKTLQSIPKYFEEVTEMCSGDDDGYYAEDFQGGTYCGCQHFQPPGSATFYREHFHPDNVGQNK